MMIPPIIRVGPPPPPNEMRNPREGLVVLIRNRGWFIVRWMPQGYLMDQDKHSRCPAIDPHDVVCWMPEDGS